MSSPYDRLARMTGPRDRPASVCVAPIKKHVTVDVFFSTLSAGGTVKPFPRAI